MTVTEKVTAVRESRCQETIATHRYSVMTLNTTFTRPADTNKTIGRLQRRRAVTDHATTTVKRTGEMIANAVANPWVVNPNPL